MSPARGTPEAAPVARAARVLILTASFGAGHNVAAAALARAFASAGATTRTVDHFAECVHPAFDRWSRRLYEATLYRAPRLWALAYGLGDRMGPSSGLTLRMTQLGSAKLGRLLDDERPDCLVCTHPTPAAALGRLRRHGLAVPPYAIVLSDFATHRQWIHPEADLHFVPAEAIRRETIARGVPEGRVVAAGIPVRPEFAEPLHQARARATLGLDPRAVVVLAMAGSQGRVGRLSEVTRVLVELPPPATALVVTGADEALATKLRARVAGREGRVRILGHAGDVRGLMAAADLLVTKAGGLALAEALAAELPIVCFGSLPGHEARNETFAVAAGAALPARSGAELARVLRAALARPDALAALRPAIATLRRPHAARDIAERMLALARRPSACYAER